MRRQQFDGLRCVLFLMVFFVHYVPDPLKFGYLGYALPVFFVMSGFLITNVLMSTEHLPLGPRLKDFYLRRILRICPAYFLVVGMLIALGLLTFPIYHLTYLVNIKLFLVSLTPESPLYLSWFVQDWRKESLHLWSLSVEEQFYILYPLVLYLTPARYRIPMLLAGLAASIGSRFFFMARQPQSFYGALLPVCAEYFIWGCIFAIWHARKTLEKLSPAPILYISTIAIVALVATETIRHDTGFLQFRITHYQTPIAVAMGFFIWSLWALRESHVINRVLSIKPLVYFGEMSYTMYLVHLMAEPLWAMTRLQVPFVGQTVGRGLACLAITVILAMLIWHLVEKPANKLRRFLPTHGRGNAATPPVAAV